LLSRIGQRYFRTPPARQEAKSEFEEVPFYILISEPSKTNIKKALEPS